MTNPIDLTRPASCTAIVCAYNEESTLAGVLMALLDSPLVDDLIVIDDGSADLTPQIVQDFDRHQRVRGICFPENRGKGHAMTAGIMQARSAALLFVDADLVNFTPEYAATVLTPLLTGQAAMIIGWPMRGDSLLDTLDPCRPLSGQRAVWRADLLPLVPLIRDSGYGVETLMNLYYQREDLRRQYVPLHGLIHPIKAEKVGFLGSLGQYAHEIAQIIRSALRHYPLLLGAYGLWPRGRTILPPPRALDDALEHLE
jgi:glycosyltransferase involved in cell wall biosynthesis